MNNMNGYTRISKVLYGETPDRIPVMLHNFMHAAKESGFTMKQYRNSPEAIANCFLNAAEKYSLDGILTDMDTALLAGACGAELDLPENEPARVVNMHGFALEEILEKMDGMSFLENERIQIYLEAIRILRRQCSNDIYLRGNADQGPFGLAFLLYGMDNFLVDLLDDERQEGIKLLLEKCLQVCVTFHKAVHDAGAHCTSFGDSASGPDLVSPAIYRKFAKPYQVRLAEELRKYGIQTLCHICGNTNAILHDMVETGCSGFEIDYKTDINLAKAAFKGKAAMSGNIDPSGVICMGSRELVKETTRTLIENYKEGGGFILGAGCAVPRETPEENIREIVKVVNESGWY